MTIRTILFILTCSAIARAQSQPINVTGTYRFTTPITEQGLREAATIVRTVASLSQVSQDIPNASLSFTGSEEAVSLAAWILPQIDKVSGDTAIHEYKLPSGDVSRVNFITSARNAQDLQELLTILRTVADVQKVYNFTPNRALVLRGPAWQVAFSEWIIQQLAEPAAQNPDTAPREFTVGGPDYRGTGHGARFNFLSNVSSIQQVQEILTVLRTVADIQKIFNYTSRNALVLRGGDSDLPRAEWLIQQLDLPARQSSGPATFSASTGDDVTRIFRLRNVAPQSLQTAVTGMRSELGIKKMFPTTTTNPATIVLRGTSDQIAAAVTWMTAHNALIE
jgi:hypothetical protein